MAKDKLRKVSSFQELLANIENGKQPVTEVVVKPASTSKESGSKPVPKPLSRREQLGKRPSLSEEALRVLREFAWQVLDGRRLEGTGYRVLLIGLERWAYKPLVEGVQAVLTQKYRDRRAEIIYEPETDTALIRVPAEDVGLWIGARGRVVVELRRDLGLRELRVKAYDV
jgi:hypothetical protein